MIRHFQFAGDHNVHGMRFNATVTQLSVWDKNVLKWWCVKGFVQSVHSVIEWNCEFSIKLCSDSTLVSKRDRPQLSCSKDVCYKHILPVKNACWCTAVDILLVITETKDCEFFGKRRRKIQVGMVQWLEVRWFVNQNFSNVTCKTSEPRFCIFWVSGFSIYC